MYYYDYKCDYNNFQCVQDQYGEFEDINSCDMSCVKNDSILYTCDLKNGKCVENKTRGFKKKSDCQLKCTSHIPNQYYCNIDNGKCTVATSEEPGSYTSIGDCLQNSVCGM